MNTSEIDPHICPGIAKILVARQRRKASEQAQRNRRSRTRRRSVKKMRDAR